MDIATIILAITYVVIITITIFFETKNNKIVEEHFRKEIELIDKQEKMSWILIEADLNKENSAVTVKKIKEVITSDQTK